MTNRRDHRRPLRGASPALPLAIALAVAALAPLAGSCEIPGRRQTHASIGGDAAALRAAFNADAGKVRLIVLVAPT
jgi:hypothetical protein